MTRICRSRMLNVDADLSPNLVLSDGSKRPWIVNPMGIEKDFPAWGIAFAILPVPWQLWSLVPWF